MRFIFYCIIFVFTPFVLFSKGSVQSNIVVYKFVYSNSINPFGKSAINNNDKDKIFWYKSDEEWKSFSVKNDIVKFQYKGSSNIDFYKKISVGEKDSFKKVGSVSVQDGQQYVIMISKGNAVEFLPMNVSPDKLPKGKIEAMNLSKRTLAICFGKDRKLLRARSTKVLSQEGKKKGVSLPVMIATELNGKWEVSYRSRIEYPEDKRSVLLIHEIQTKSIPSFSVRIVQF